MAQGPVAEHMELANVVGDNEDDDLLCLETTKVRVVGKPSEFEPGALEASVSEGAPRETRCNDKHQMYRADLDGLRALSVTAVVLFHVDASMLPGGFAGVDVFFVISGYVVSASMSIMYQKHCKSTDFLLEFYARRVQRLFPALLAVFWLGSLAMARVIPYWLRHNFLMDCAGLSLIGFTNVYLAYSAVDYWAQDFKSVDHYNFFLHMWSLGVEEQFYVAFSLLVCLVGGSHTRCFVVVMSFLVGASIFVCVHVQDTTPMFAYFLMPARFWELAAGVGLSQIELRRTSLFLSLSVMYRVRCAASVLGGVLFTIAIFSTPTNNFPMPWAGVSVSAAASIIVAGWGQSEPLCFNWILIHPWIVYIGQMSYCIYLVHWPVVVAFKWYRLDQSPKWCLVIPVIWLTSICLYHCWELPARASKQRQHVVLLIAMSSVGIGALWYWFLASGGGHKFIYAGSFGTTDAVPPFSPWNGTCECAAPAGYKLEHVPFFHDYSVAKTRAENLQPCFVERDNDWRLPAERSPVLGIDDLRSQSIRPVEAPHGVLWVFGDSHSENLAQGLQFATLMKIVSFSTLLWSPKVDISAVLSNLDETMHAGDMVAIAYLAQRLRNTRALERFEDRLRHMQALVVRKRAELLLFGDWQDLQNGNLGPLCVPLRGGHRMFNCSVSKTKLLQNRAPCNDMLKNISSLPSAHFMDLLDVFCDGDTCDETLPGTTTLGFSDSTHLTSAGMIYMSPFLCRFLEEIRQRP